MKYNIDASAYGLPIAVVVPRLRSSANVTERIGQGSVTIAEVGTGANGASVPA